MFNKDSLLEMSQSSHSPHKIIPTLIIGGHKVLDVGCNTGMIGKAILEEKNAIVDGIDINPDALSKAGEKYRKTFQRDLYLSKLDIDNEQYDYILFADILEHMPRPDLLLKDSLKYSSSR